MEAVSGDRGWWAAGWCHFVFELVFVVDVVVAGVCGEGKWEVV